MRISSPSLSYINHRQTFTNWNGEENGLHFLKLIILFTFQSCICLNDIWKFCELVRFRKCLLPYEVTALFPRITVKSYTNQIIHSSVWIFCFQNCNIFHYQYTCKAAVIKLSFWVRWHVMLLLRCRLQELGFSLCHKMTGTGLLRGSCQYMNLHLRVSICVSMWLHKQGPRFLIDLPWLQLCIWTCGHSPIWVMKGWKELRKGAIITHLHI